LAPPRDPVVTAAAFARPNCSWSIRYFIFVMSPSWSCGEATLQQHASSRPILNLASVRKRRTDDIGSLPLTHSHGSIPEHLQCSGVGSAIIMNRAGPLLLGRLPGVTTTRTWPPALLSTELAFTGRVIGWFEPVQDGVVKTVLCDHLKQHRS